MILGDTLLRQPTRLLPLLAGVAAVSAVAAVLFGGVTLGLADVAAVFGDWVGLVESDPVDPAAQAVLEVIRVPRVLLACCVGATLGVGGAVMQALFRNPLADPSLIGVSAGAAAAVAVTIVLTEVAGTLLPLPRAWQMPVAAFLGGLVTTAAVYALAQGNGRTSVAGMLLAGIALNAVASAVVGLMSYLSDDQQLRQLSMWSMGSLGSAAPGTLTPALTLMLVSTLGGVLLWRPLNLMLLGEAEAFHLGVAVDRLKAVAVVLVAIGVGASVAAAGPVAFVGLVAPHLVRLLGGSDHRLVLPGAALLGSAMVCLADLVARTVVLPAEMPVGLVLAGVGGPFFVGLLIVARRRGDWA
ncbi:FecCD family ABC transporter permease [Caenispirillum bisanense]|uniref:Iron complex transport system permease protein n=1 Tax=Caenispirillum bisanense TaxID=414052 RepID=A0A286GSY5_9PROT|nr:iron ABC transporter permease [Caenispirillum bisanense]SOD98189.1 iron complex transport system permease protein [Caenispirillum bisanense]